MILNKNDLKEYLEKDKFALGIDDREYPKFFGDYIWKYQIILRKREYFFNNKEKNFFFKVAEKWYYYKHQQLGVLLGFDIPVNL